MRVKRIWTIRLAALFLGAAFIALGIYRGEVTAVLRKAVVICMECIGLG